MITKLTPFRLTPEDLDLLGVCQEHVGVRSRSEAIRAVLRSYARTEGLLLTSGHQAAKLSKAIKSAKKVTK